MDVGTSKGLESFLAFLRETTERHRMAEADRAEAEAATQDLLHALELGDDKAPGRARLGLKIREVRRQRRTAKDIAEQTRPVVDWVEQNRTVIKGLERLLGDVRKQERRSEGRSYAPRTHILEDIRREKAERAAMKKQLQAEGVLPPDKSRLNRKKFARETWAEWEEFLKSDPIRAEVSLLRAVEFIAGPELPAVTPEQVGVYKALKLAVEYNKFLRKLEAEGRSKYTIGELADEVVLPIWKL